MANTYTIKEIDKESGNIKVLFDCDGSIQTIAGAPLDDANALKDFVNSYAVAYKSGLDQVAVTVPDDVKALVNKKQDVEVESETPVEE